MEKISLFIIVACWFLPISLSAQNEWEEVDNEIESVEIEIVKNREIKLPTASRNFEKIPPAKVNSKRRDVEYTYNNIDFDLPDLNVRMRPLRIKDERLSKLYGNYVKAGFGNFVTPYLEGFFNSKRSKEYSYGAHLNFLRSGRGPVDGSNSGSGKFDLDLFGKYFTPVVTFSGDLGFDQRKYNFYGYDEGQEIDEDTLKQHFNNFYMKFSMQNSREKSDFNYFGGVRIDYLKDKKEASESDAQLTVKLEYTLSDQSFVKLDGYIANITRQDSRIDKQSRNLSRIKPTFGFEYEGFKISAGFNTVFENDSIDDENMHFYPVARASYPFSDNVELYAGIGGDIEKNTLRTLSEENPYLNDNVAIFHTNKTFEFYGGLNGKLSKKLGTMVGFSASNYQNMYFFVNSPEDRSKFDIIYDRGNTAVFNLFGQLSFNTNEIFRIMMKADYWGYSTDEVDEAWHKPSYRFTTLSSYNLYGKFLFTLEAFAMGGIKGYDSVNDETVELNPFFDLNFKTDYLISDQVSAFVQFNNIFSKEYELFYRYPSRGLQFMLGVTYSF